MQSGDYVKAITWLLLGALLRGKIKCLSSYFVPENYSEFIPENHPNTILPNEVIFETSESVHDYITVSTLESNYVNRPSLLKLLDSELNRSNKPIVYISGMGGSGKTTLARLYAQKNYSPANIYWLTYGEGNEKKSLSTVIKENDSDPQDFYSSLDSNKLIIIDNMNLIDTKFHEELLRNTGAAKIIITTRSKQTNNRQVLTMNSESLEETKQFAFEVFKSNYTAEPLDSPQKTLQEDEGKYVNSICRCLLYNALAISIVASELREWGEDGCIKAFAHRLTTNGLISAHFSNYEGTEILWGDDYTSIPDILTESFKDIISYGGNFTDIERQIFSLLSLMPAFPCSFKEVCHLMGDSKSRFHANTALRKLMRRNWLQGNMEEDTVYLHPLIAEVLKEENCLLGNTEEKNFLQHLLKNWLCLEEQEQNKSYMIRQIWQESDIIQDYEDPLNIALRYSFGIDNKAIHIQSMFPSPAHVITAMAKGNQKFAFLYYNLKEKEEHIIFEHYLSYYGRKTESLTLPYTSIKLLALEPIPVSDSAHDIDLIFPDTLLDIPITHIPDYFCPGSFIVTIRKLRLPEGLLSIGDYAFDDLQIGEENFIYPETLPAEAHLNEEGILTIPDHIVHIPDSAFANNSEITKIIFPSGLKTIGWYAFENCTALTSLEFPDSLSEIGLCAFQNCTALTSLEFPDGLSEIGQSAFENCIALTSLEFPDGLHGISTSAFQNCTALTSLKFPDGLYEISKSAFENCSNLTGPLLLPNTVTDLDDYCFKNCSQITELPYLPEQLQIMGSKAFAGCSNMKGIFDCKLPYLYHWELDCFEDCSNITCSTSVYDGATPRHFSKYSTFNITDNKLYFDPDISYIDDFTCEGLTSIKSLILPDDLFYIGKRAFARCTGLEGSLFLPSEVTFIQNEAFADCYNLNDTLTISTLETLIIDDYAFRGTNFKTVIFHCPDVELSENALDGLPEDTIFYIPENSNYEFEFYFNEHRLNYRYLSELNQ